MIWFIVVFSLFFALTSVFHGFFNSVYSENRQRRKIILYAHYAALMCFTLTAFWYLYSGGVIPYVDLLLIGWGVAVVHIVRFVLDWLDLRGRETKMDVLRPAADATANFVTIAFITTVVSRGNYLLSWIALLFSFTIVFKEIKYRTIDDFYLRNDSTVTTSQGGTGHVTNENLSGWHAYAGRYIKSFFYIIVGFSLIYMCLSVVDPSLKSIIQPNGGTPLIISAIGFSFQAFFRLTTGDTTIPLFIVAVLEAGAGLLMWYNSKTIASPRRR